MAKRFKFGKAFPDQLAKISVKHEHFKHTKDAVSWKENFIFGFSGEKPSSQISNLRRYFFIFISFASLLGLFFRVFHLQIVEGETNRNLADSNRIQIKVVHAARGVIYDRNGKILAQNEPGFRLVAQDKTIKLIDRDEALKMEVQNDPSLQSLEVDNLRSYPLGKVTAHIIGYVDEINQDELKDPKFKNYKLGDQIGRSGIEKVYEPLLKGIDGGEVVEVDAKGKKIRTLREIPPIPGQNLILSIDKDLQDISYTKLQEAIEKSGSCCGVAIVQDPKTGEILSLVSIPAFDPSKIQDSLNLSDSPFLNRAIAGTYPPGSIFKIVAGTAGLLSGKITARTQFEDTGVINLGPFKFTNWYFNQYGKKEGMVDLVKALKRSNDTFFYHLGGLVGEKLIGETARKFGLGQTSRIDLPGETTGLVPDNEWKVKNFNTPWYPGDTLHMAIGQGFVLITPIQVSNLISTIIRDGMFIKPSVALKISDPSGRIIQEFKPEEKRAIDLTENQSKLIKKGLEQVPQSGGTAWPFFTFPIKTAGKTGTAEFGDAKDKTHAWYTAYAPVDDPQMVVTILVEAGGEGSSIAGPVVKEIMRWYFSPDKANLIKDIYPIATESARTLGE